MSEKKKKNKTISRGAKLYAFACLLSLIIGVASLYSVRSFIIKTLESSEKTVVIPPYEKIIAQNEGIKAIEELKRNNTTQKTAEPAEETEKTVKTVKTVETEENASGEESVNVMSDAASIDEKAFSFTVPCAGEIVKVFSLDKPIKSRTLGDFRTHNGIDIKASQGTTVCAAEAGVVESIYDDNLLGVTIVISHSESLTTEYANLAGADMVKVGMEVEKGQAIGCVGNTAKGELLDEAHLHFAVMENGKYINPESVIV